MGIEEAATLLTEAYKYYLMSRQLLEKNDFSVSVQASQSCIYMLLPAFLWQGSAAG